jgi:hypothetical protein
MCPSQLMELKAQMHVGHNVSVAQAALGRASEHNAR